MKVPSSFSSSPELQETKMTTDSLRENAFSYWLTSGVAQRQISHIADDASVKSTNEQAPPLHTEFSVSILSAFNVIRIDCQELDI